MNTFFLLDVKAVLPVPAPEHRGFARHLRHPPRPLVHVWRTSGWEDSNNDSARLKNYPTSVCETRRINKQRVKTNRYISGEKKRGAWQDRKAVMSRAPITSSGFSWWSKVLRYISAFLRERDRVHRDRECAAWSESHEATRNNDIIARPPAVFVSVYSLLGNTRNVKNGGSRVTSGGARAGLTLPPHPCLRKRRPRRFGSVSRKGSLVGFATVRWVRSLISQVFFSFLRLLSKKVSIFIRT